jgi:hypothetical protein
MDDGGFRNYFRDCIFLLLLVTMAVSLINFHEIEVKNAAFTVLAIFFLIGMTNGGRTNLKIFQSLDF